MSFYTNRVIKLGSYFIKKLADDRERQVEEAIRTISNMIDLADKEVPSDNDLKSIKNLFSDEKNGEEFANNIKEKCEYLKNLGTDIKKQLGDSFKEELKEVLKASDYNNSYDPMLSATASKKSTKKIYK